MDERPELRQGEPDLAQALRKARIENAERAEALSDLRDIELGRLALLESALEKVVRQAPPEVDLFELALARGERPRVFLDMVAFIEMGRDRRTYRFFQDTLYGRILIAESPKIDAIVAACTNYVARRLIERERALRAPIPQEGADEEAPRASPPQPECAGAAAAPAGVAPSVRRKRSFWGRLFDAVALLLMALGAMTLVFLVAFAAVLAGDHGLGDALARLRDAASSLGLPRP